MVMVRLLTQRCSARVDFDGDVDAQAREHSRRCSHRRSKSAKRAGLHVIGLWRVSLGVSLVPAYWQVRVFGLSYIVNRPSNCLHVRTILLSRCMDRSSR